jgi:quercetin dioxygenase-like cupin family protein
MSLNRRDFLNVAGTAIAASSALVLPLSLIKAQEESTPENEILFTPVGTGETYWILTSLFTHLVTGEESGGSYFTLEVVVPPGDGPPPHIHHVEEEQFYILEGDVTFYVGDQTFEASVGDFVHIPRDTVHYWTTGSTGAKVLATFSPAGIEGFFRAVGEPVVDPSAPPPLTEARVAKFLAVEANGWKEHHDTLPPA